MDEIGATKLENILTASWKGTYKIIAKFCRIHWLQLHLLLILTTDLNIVAAIIAFLSLLIF